MHNSCQKSLYCIVPRVDILLTKLCQDVFYSLKYFQNELNKENTQFDTRTEQGTSMHKWLLNMSLHSPYIGDSLENLYSKKVKHINSSLLCSYVNVFIRQMLLISVLLLPAVFCQNDLDFWNVERPPDMANIASLEVMCGKTHMEVQISFDRPFNGIIFSKGAIDQYNCIYVKPQTGSGAYSFNIMYDQVITFLPFWPQGTLISVFCVCNPEIFLDGYK